MDKSIHQRDNTCGTVWRENRRDKTEVVWTFTEVLTQERWVYWEKDAEDGTARKVETVKA